MQSRRSDLGSSVIIVAISFTILVFLALASTTWAAPPGQGNSVGNPTETPTERGGTETPPVQTQTPCGDPGECISGSKSISIPVGAIPPGSKLNVQPLASQPPCPASPDGQTFLDHCFKVDWLGPDGQYLKTFALPVKDCLSYTPADVAAAGGNPANLLIGFVFGDPTAKWTLVKPTVESGASRVCANPADPFYYQALFTPKPTLPVTGADNKSYYWMVLIALLGALVAAFVWRAARIAPR